MSDSGFFLYLERDHFVPINMIVGVFSLDTKNVSNLCKKLRLNGKLLELCNSTSSKTLVLLKNGLGVACSEEPQSINNRIAPDPYPAILKTLLMELLNK